MRSKFLLRRITLDTFRRVTSSGAYIPEIDGLRFIAIVLVVFLHCYAELVNRIGMGAKIGLDLAANVPPELVMDNQHFLLRLLLHAGYGVELFFGISGFILAWPFAKQHLQAGRKVRLSAYFLRRITRLEPPYILMLLIRAALLLAVGLRAAHVLLLHLIVSVFYLHNVTFGVASSVEAVSWTLEIEVQFYCLAPFLTLIYKLRRAWLRRALLICMIVSATPLQRAFLPGWYGPRNEGAFYLSILAFIQFFLVGLLVADLYVDGWKRIPNSWRWDAVSLPLWVLMLWLRPTPFLYFGPMILPVLFVGAFKGSLIPKILRNRLISTTGGMCYSIYLTHRTTILACQLLLVRFHLGYLMWVAVSLLLIAPAAIVVGAVYFLLIEKPCMNPRWPQQLIERLRSGPRSRPPKSPLPKPDRSPLVAENGTVSA